MFSDKLIKNKRIAVIGAGPSGLSLACLLQKRGATDVKVYERDINRFTRIQGGSLDIHQDSGQLIIKASGLLDQFQNKKIRTGGSSHSILDKDAKLHYMVPEFKLLNSRPEIDRGDLRDLFLDALEEDTVLWNHHLIGVEIDNNFLNNNSVTLKFQDGTVDHVDILIGGDGYNSKVRNLLLPPDKVQGVYKGILLIQSEIENPSERCPQIDSWVANGSMFALGDGKLLGAQQKSSGNLVVFFSTKKNEDFVNQSNLLSNNNDLIREFLFKEFNGWNQVFIDLIIEATTSVPITARLLYGNICEKWETNPRVTLIGDSAHTILPFTGEGANIAMLDSLDLVNELTDPNNNSTLNNFICFYFYVSINQPNQTITQYDTSFLLIVSNHPTQPTAVLIYQQIGGSPSTSSN
ncbi:hypothetical protein PPL_00372 [Heterostelium album PN500]|uniref:FAD-binding domain-containing protein n=1 Tax=Heterostelium pallidum (strain ATCC 26659 / Pp 5 / PN500) TaxID=670386 RepID=D3AW98_HETP5|nr:hypothetical protein PPL_00372 [Heterostelium album PN500]EFA86571.1 hypothetical protein PPL_00372 [Heterostelium album PN500]|eukprot:XP_020438676.1 hypothetical protein PPL_00372 [Heterostelium album PN500]